MAHSISPPVRILAPLVLALTSACPGEPLPVDDEVGESTQTDEDSTDSTDSSTTGEPSRTLSAIPLSMITLRV